MLPHWAIYSKAGVRYTAVFFFFLTGDISIDKRHFFHLSQSPSSLLSVSKPSDKILLRLHKFLKGFAYRFYCLWPQGASPHINPHTFSSIAQSSLPNRSVNISCP